MQARPLAATGSARRYGGRTASRSLTGALGYRREHSCRSARLRPSAGHAGTVPQRLRRRDVTNGLSMSDGETPTGIEDRWLVIPGKIFRFVFLVGAASLVFYGFSPDIINRPLGTLTISEILGWLIAIALVVWLMKLAFKSTSDEAAELWGYGALLSVIGFIALIVYATRH